MAKKTVAELEREIDQLEGKYKEALKREESEKKIKDLQRKLVRHKYRRQLAVADKAAQSASRGLKSLGKSLVSGMRAVNQYAEKLEKQEKVAKRKSAKKK